MADDKAVVTMGADVNLNPTPGGAQTAEKPVEVEVKVGDKTLKVDAATAAAIQALQETASQAGKASETAIKLQAEIENLKAAAETKTAKPDADNYNDLFVDPKGFLTRFAQEMRQNILAEVRGETATAAAQTQFWAEFYKRNDDLKDADVMVRAVMQRDFGALKNLSVDAAINKLAESTRGEILKLTKKGGGTSKPAAEGGTETRTHGSKHETTTSEHSQTSISAVIAERRAARRKVATNAQ